MTTTLPFSPLSPLSPRPQGSQQAGDPVRAAEAGKGSGGGEIRPLPVWFFAFEGVMSSAYDLLRAYPQAMYALVAVAVVNIGISLTVLRPRVRLAKRLWRGKGTRKVAVGLVLLRVGAHVVLGALGLAVAGTFGHLLLTVLMSATTVTLLWYAQRTALRAIARDEARTAG
ncbi:hypothetical protein AB0I49_12190 [Streptomyces sp. NPDC050617]|uniref:hypothetical protein n=1 Tax=Streptomyces sp. NPDC050617 TaxID=3154628 RepID=UPI0034475CD7